ncbi:MAG: hypothetical protein LBV41_08330 [Cytophagaceae bacterium]|nr:hypothetical protein [Cytophagaceae bacterium]
MANVGAGFARPSQLTGNRQQHSCPQGQNLYIRISLPLRAGRYEHHFPQATLRFDTSTGSVTEAVVEPVETQRPARRCGYEDSAFWLMPIFNSRLFCVT